MSGNDSRNRLQKLQKLRAAAEARAALAKAKEPFAAEKLLHELQVHQIELEMQNEELRQAHAALEISRDRYSDLYEFAPIGYLTLTAEGLITEINLAGARLLGMERKLLIHRRFVRFVAGRDKDRWHRLFLNAMRNTDEEKQSFDLQLCHADGSVTHVHLDCLRRADKNEAAVLRIALADITELKQAEAELLVAATAFESQEGIFITDADCMILKVNQAFTKITGYSAEEVIGQTPCLFTSGSRCRLL